MMASRGCSAAGSAAPAGVAKCSVTAPADEVVWMRYSATPPGTRVPVTVLRQSGSRKTVQVTLGTYPGG